MAEDDNVELLTQVDELKKQLETAQARYSTLRGKYDAEVAHPKAGKRGEDAQPLSPENVLSEAELETVDRDAVKLQMRIAKGTVGPEIESLRQEVQAAREQTAAQRLTQVWKDADVLSQGVKQINDTQDPSWIAFLQTTEGLSGMSFFDIGSAALGRGDAATLARIHQEFLRASGSDATVKPRGSPSGTAAPQGGAVISQADFEKSIDDLKHGRIDRKVYMDIERRFLEAFSAGKA
jgi:hypothetical protein